MAFAAFGCEPMLQRDSCLNDEGPDPIHNFMGYNDDKCMYQWTQGQAEEMRASIEAYRKRGGHNNLNGPAIELVDGEAYGPIPSLLSQDIVVYTFRGVFDERHGVACTTVTDNGDVDLFLNWNGSLENFECSAEGPSSLETCSMTTKNATDTAYAVVYASSATRNVNITCFRYYH